MIVKLLVDGGAMTPGPAIAQKLGPMGINIGQVISKVNEATKNFKGIKVPVDLNIDPVTKQFEVSVRSPPVPELIKKELGIGKGSGDHKKTKVANISIEQVIKISKTKLPEMLEKDLKACVKTIVGSCMSLGILVDSKSGAQVCKEIDNGKYDKEIKEEKTEVSSEKRAELDNYFNDLTSKQQAALKLAEAEKEAAEAKKKETVTATPVVDAKKDTGKDAKKDTGKDVKKDAKKTSKK